MMKHRIYLSLLAFSFLFIFSTHKTYAQNNRKNKKTKKVVIKTPSKRVNSKTVVYKSPKKKVTSVRVLPNRRVIKHKGTNYYYSNNRYYTYSGGRYVSIRPKIGFRINQLPSNAVIIKHRNRNYRWLNGIFYIQINNEYEVVEPEIGTVIYQLPSDYERVVINGQTFYEFSNVLYEKIQINGTRAYEVVGFIEQ